MKYWLVYYTFYIHRHTKGIQYNEDLLKLVNMNYFYNFFSYQFHFEKLYEFR